MIRLLSYDRQRLASLRRDPTRVDTLAVVADGLPPSFIRENAEKALAAGRRALWFSPFAFVDDETGRVVGSASSRASPTTDGSEIGYGVADGCRGQVTRPRRSPR